MTIPDFLSDLAGKDIKVWLEGTQLRCSAPPGALTSEFRDQLRDRKSEIIGFLNMATATAKQQRAIVPLQPLGTRTPIFAVPGHAGAVFSFSDLSKRLGDEQPFFALEPPGLDGGTEPMERIEDIAEYFANQILEYQPIGPYIIVGYCSGASTAFELAKLLDQRGAIVECLALFGPIHPSTYQSRYRLLRFEAKRRFGAVVHHMRKAVRLPSSEARLQYLNDRLRYLGKRARERGNILRPLLSYVGAREEAAKADPVLARRARLADTATIAVSRFHPAPYLGRICIFLPNKAWVELRSRAVSMARVGPPGRDLLRPEELLRPAYAPGAGRTGYCRPVPPVIAKSRGNPMNQILPSAMESVSFPLMNDHDHRTLVVEYNATAASYPLDKSIIDIFQEQTARNPDAEAIQFGDERLSFRELDERSNQMAAHLASTGTGAGQIVVVLMEHSIEFVVAILGILKSGAAYVPLDAATPKGRLTTLLKDIADGTGKRTPVAVTQSHLQSAFPPDLADVFLLDADFRSIAIHPGANQPSAATPEGTAYIIFTSGSTGVPKGVMISHRSLVNYIWWASQVYSRDEGLAWPLFTSLAFDLTVTTLFTPLISGGKIVVYRGDPGAQSMVVLKVIDDNAVDIVKLTPAHLAMIRDRDLRSTRLRKFIVGGEDFKTELARDITTSISHPVEIYNEYGPTEATVGCMIHQFDIGEDQSPSVPIGTPAANAGIYVLDERHQPVPPGTIGEMFISGDGLAKGYFNRPDLTNERFLTTAAPRDATSRLRLYKTGDLARWNSEGRLDFLGRIDHQVKVGGARVELGEIEARLLKHPDIQECAVTAASALAGKPATQVRYCERCGISSDTPDASYDADGVCNLCRAFDTYVEKAQTYFKSPDDLQALILEMQSSRKGDYDCIVLLSGGKDSSFMLCKLVAMGVKPLTFTLDNGFISEEAKANIRRLVNGLGVDHHWGSTPYMNEIFVDSLKRFSNVCNGCFKTIYTLATNFARERGIGYIVTGLSRGQFFETRLTEEVFKRDDYDPTRLDALVTEARKEYHRREDAVSRYLDVDVFRNDSVFEEVKFIDFYRYWSVPLEDMLEFLTTQAGWNRPADTGRSTNCLINDVGIYLHKKQRGYHNYALPYSWDVRLGQKTREEAIDELNDELDVPRIKEIMTQIGYIEPAAAEDGIARLVAYYVSPKDVPVSDLRSYLAEELPDSMMPTHFVRLERMPLTINGKIDRAALPEPTAGNIQPVQEFIAPSTATETTLASLWCDLLKVESIGRNDNFFNLGGHSLLVMRAVSRLRETFGVDVQLRNLFERPTVAGLAEVIDGMLWFAAARAPSSSEGPREEIEI